MRDRFPLTRFAAGRPASGWPLLFALPVCQLAAIIWLVWNRTPHLPWWDEWELANFLEVADLGRLHLADFWTFQNEHRIFLPRLILFALIKLTAWDRQVIMTLNLVVACVGAALIGVGLRRTVGAVGARLLFVPASLLLFSFGNYENWLFAFQLNFILAFCGVACCLWALTPLSADRGATDRRWWFAVLGAIVASLSTLSGLVAWFAFLPAIWRCGRVARAVWCLTAVGIILPYFNGFPRGTVVRASLLDAIDYALVCLGAPLGATVSLARLWGFVGVAGMAALLLAYWRSGGQWRRLAGWLGLALHALGTVLVTTIGRAALGPEQALTSRYRLFSALWWVALLVVGYLAVVAVRRAAAPRWSPRIVRRATIAACLLGGLPLLLGLGQANRAGFVDGLNWQESFRQHERCVLDYPEASDDCLEEFYVSAPIVRIHAAFLEQHQLGAFRAAATSAPLRLTRGGSILAKIDTVDGTAVTDEVATVSADAPVVIRGWALDSAARAPGSTVYLWIDERYTYRAVYGDERPDVAATTGIAATEVGFAATLPPGMLTPREHTLTVVVVAADGRSYGVSPQPMTIAAR